MQSVRWLGFLAACSLTLSGCRGAPKGEICVIDKELPGAYCVNSETGEERDRSLEEMDRYWALEPEYAGRVFSYCRRSKP